MLPALTVIALLIWLGDGGSPFFAQRRIGRGGILFPCLKFRTMVRDSSERLQALLESDEAAALEWARDQKLRNDPRITPLGGFLRKTSLDEIPQLANVLLGHMSMVGPRPIVEERSSATVTISPAIAASGRASPASGRSAAATRSAIGGGWRWMSPTAAPNRFRSI